MIDIKKTKCFKIEHDGELIVAIYVDGTIEYGEGVEPDAAARIFWDTVVDYMLDCQSEN